MSTIAENHAYWRNIWLWTCFSLGAVNSYYYYNQSLYAPNTQLLLLPVIFTAYISWDCYKMVTVAVLYRLDLLIHHFVCYISYVYIARHNIWLFASIVVTCENVSLFNYWLSTPWLLKYKLFVILCYRIPFWLFFMYVPCVVDEWKDHAHFLWTGTTFFLCYDLFTIQKIIKNKLLYLV